MPETLVVADGTAIARAERAGMSAATFEATRPHEARVVFGPAPQLQIRCLPAGTWCEIRGMPFRLMNATQVECRSTDAMALVSQCS
jgi:hypothetical protein